MDENSPSFEVPEHELLSLIGQGSYGEVWLARNQLGTYRAVKIITLARFHDKQPFNRELEGVKRFEPISRFHTGLVDILQVGHNPELGFFYYVMELGDSFIDDQPFEIDSYQPKTLHSYAKQYGRLPAKECIEIGISICKSLDFLHNKGLVHRDLKPSNILFVNGELKLGDIGLVSEIDENGSIVGTVGYIPPEGPGNASGDIYSVGKLLYELSTGLSVNEFPQLPENIGDFPDRARMLELDTIISKACAPNPKSRYESASELLRDLELLATGSKIQLQRRRLSLLPKVGLPVAVLGLLGTLLIDYYWHPLITQIELKYIFWISLIILVVFTTSYLFGIYVRGFFEDYVLNYWYKLFRLAKSYPNKAPHKQSGSDSNLAKDNAVSPINQSNYTPNHFQSGNITYLENQSSPTEFFKHSEFQRIRKSELNQVEFVDLTRIEESFKFYRSHLSDEYSMLLRQARITFFLWVTCVSLGCALLFAGIIALLLGQIAEGVAVTIGSTLVYFIQQVFYKREDHYRSIASAKNRHLEYGNNWLLAIQSIDSIQEDKRKDKRRRRLVDALLEKLKSDKN